MTLSKREQFDILSRELLGRMNDVTPESPLFFPFEFTLSEELETRYFPVGSKLRTLTIHSMIVIDNSFKKFQILPSHDIMVTYVETQKSLLFDWQESALAEFKRCMEEPAEGEEPLSEDVIKNELAEFKKVLEKITKDINEASKPVIKRVGTSDEAKDLNGDMDKEQQQGGFTDFIHNTISNLFK